MLKTSMFNVCEKVNENETLVYNILTQSFFIYDNRKITNWEVEVDQKFLQKGKFLVPQNLSEVDYIKGIFRKINSNNQSLDIVLSITTYCQMRCVYCYEEGMTYKFMSKDTLLHIVKWVNLYTSLKDIHSVNILLFGGEPMYDFKLLSEYVVFLKSHINAKLTFSLATNGLELTTERVKWLAKQGLNSIQITIDGLKEMHEIRRPRVDNKPNFERIISGIQSVKNVENVEIILKVNIDKNNIKNITKLLSYFKENNFESFVVLKFEAVAITQASTNLNAGEHFCDIFAYSSRKAEMSEAYHYCMEHAKKMGFRISPSIGNITPCMYTAKNKYVFGVDGEIYKCISSLGIDRFKIADVKTFFSNQTLYEEACSRINLSDQCLSAKCPFVPKCGGGCAYEAYLKNNNINGIDCKKEFFLDYYKRKFLITAGRENVT